MKQAAPIGVEVWRGGALESMHRVHAVVSDGAGNVLSSVGDPSLVTFLRSSAKPFQALPLITSGAAERYQLTPTELALACGSHKGERRHAETAAGMLARVGLDEAALQCAAHATRSGEARESALCNNCSGKHAGMLLVQAHLGGDASSYLDVEAPAQRAIRASFAEVAGHGADIKWAVDGCGAPTPACELRVGARMFARLAMPSGVDKATADALGRLARAMAAHPEMVNGAGGFDTDLMGASEDRLLAKGGAEGYQGVSDLVTGAGLVLKVEDGDAARRAVASATVEALRQLSWLEGRAFEVLGDWWMPSVRNLAGKTVGEVKPVLRLTSDWD